MDLRISPELHNDTVFRREKSLRKGTGSLAQWVQCLPGMHEALGCIPGPCKPSTITHTCNPSTAQMGSKDQEFKVIVCYSMKLRTSWATREPAPRSFNEGTRPVALEMVAFLWTLGPD